MASGQGWVPTRAAGKSPFPRSELAAVEHTGKVLVWGGLEGGADSPTELVVLNTGMRVGEEEEGERERGRGTERERGRERECGNHYV